LLKVENLNVYYGQFHVIQDLSLEILAGEAVGLVGPNGHGKSTLLKAICGLIPIDSGTVSFKGEQTNGKTAPDLVQRGLVYIAEDRRLFPEMTVRENLMLGAYLRRGQERKEENLQLVFGLYPRLEERQDQLANTLSGGEAQMLALGRGLMSAADFMAIDEPSLGLAPNLVRTMLDTIERIKKIRHHDHAGRTEYLSAGEIHRPRVRAGRRKDCRRHVDRGPPPGGNKGLKTLGTAMG
jgi:branched-chain amino acid transport system ATP-binding protein